ncbi:MAG TPA: 30S ribosomal protein S17 [Candidatus Gracilibacteria bacterium]|nr:30S ribosomal protein S17 [Candidatus Gracilibacteria bacterium]
MRTKKGIVTSTKMDKTIVVTVHTYKTHPKYKKRYQISKKFYAHDEENKCQVGDKVTIYESKPLSKLKRWTVEAPSKEKKEEKKEAAKK